MRIVGGKFRGRRLFVPRGPDVRPTSDRVREAIFSILADKVEGARVLDLFAGTGALGLEALSRGAARAAFVDRRPLALKTINRNVEALGLEGSTRVLRTDLSRGPGGLRQETGPFDLIFMDPPYGKGLVAPALGMAVRLGLAGPETQAVVEQYFREARPRIGPEWILAQERVYGRTRVSFLYFSCLAGHNEA